MAGFLFPSSLELPLGLFQFLEDDKVQNLIQFLNNSQFPVKMRKHSELLPALEKLLALPGKKEKRALDDFFGFLKAFLNMSDDSEEFKSNMERVIYATDYDDKVKDRAVQFIQSLNFAEEYIADRRLENYTKRANSYLSGLSYACELRGRFRQNYDYDSIPIEQYKPELVDVVPVITVSLDLRGLNVEDCWFQADEEKLNEMIATLLAAQKELKQLKESVRGA